MPTALDVFNKLKGKLGDDEAQALVEFVQDSVEKGTVTKEDLYSVRDEFKGDLQILRDEFSGKLQGLRDEVIGEVRRLDGKIDSLERRVDQVEAGLGRKIERFFLFTLLALFVLNGDKVITFLANLLKLIGK